MVVGAALSGCSSAASGAGAESNVIRIGVSAPLTGTYSTLAPAADGIRAYFEALNASGELGDLKVEVLVKDDAYDPSKTPAVVRKLVEDDKVDMMCGPIGTATSATVTDYLTGRKMPTLAMTGEPKFATPGSTIFEVASSYEIMGAAAAEDVLARDPDAKIAIAYTPDALGEPFRDAAETYLKSVGKSATAVEFEAALADLSAPVAKLKVSGAKYVLVNHTSAILAKLAKSAEQQGYRPNYYSTNAPLDLKLPALAGNTLNNLRLVTPYRLGTEPELENYRKAVQTYTKASPTEPIVVNGWTAAESCGSALKVAVKDAGGKPDSAQILRAMENLKVNTDFLPNFSWSATKHDGTNNLHVVAFDGKSYREVRGYRPAPNVG
jgi:ABC-type branched-subunit amino acid transport system substrate-binding protein